MTAIQPRPTPYWTGPSFVVRVAGMATGVLDRLRTHRTLALIEQVIEIDHWLDQQRDRLCDELHALIGGNDDTASRRRLIALRRDIHLGRPLKAGVPDATALPAMSSRTAADLARWLQQVTQRRALIARAESELETESREVRNALKEIAADVNLRHGLVLASPSLYATLAKWLAATEPPRPDRKLERRLVKYITRTATKTSPYSTFTGSAEGRWSTGDAAVRCATTSPLSSRRSVVELNAFTQRQIRRAIAMLPELRPHMILTVNTSVIEAGGVIRFLGKQEHEALIELAATPTLRRFVDEVRGGADPSYGGLIDSLARGDSGDRKLEIARYLDKLIGIGLFEVSLDIPDGAVDQLGRLERELRRFDGPRLAALGDRVGALRIALDHYTATPTPDERAAQARTIQQELAQLYQALGWDWSGDEFPRHPFYEDTLLPGAVIECSGAAWSRVLDDLNLVQQLAGAYDRFLPGRIAAAAFVEDHHGAGAAVPFLAFYGAFCREIRQPAKWRPDHRVSGADLLTCYEKPYPVPQVGLERLAALAELQRRIAAHIAALPVDAGVRRAAPADLHDLVAGFPAFVRPIESTAFHCQVVPGDGRPRVVLNELVMGFGRSRARLLRLDGGSGGGVFSRAPRVPDGERRRHAEIGGAMASNLNLRQATAALEISYPGGVSDRPRDERVALSDLVVEHDARTGELRLISQSRGTEIAPVHVGAMVEFLLPPAYRFLIQIFGQAVPRFEFIKALANASAYHELDAVRRFPRLCIGDVVVNRATWTTDAPRVPRQAKGESELGFLHRVQQWRQRHALPERCFVRTFGLDFARPTLDAILNKSRKPLYIDFASPLLLDVLEHIPPDPDRLVVFEEMLPTPDDAVVRDGTGAYASEFVVELTMRGDGDA